MCLRALVALCLWALPWRMHVRCTRALGRLRPALDEVPAPRALPACDASQVLEHRLVEHDEGRLIDVLPPAALGAASGGRLRELSTKPLALRALFHRVHRGEGTRTIERAVIRSMTLGDEDDREDQHDDETSNGTAIAALPDRGF